MSSSPMSTRPAVGSSSPATIRRVVVLPHPDGPSSAKNEPSGTVSVRSSTATKSPNRLVTPSRLEVLAVAAQPPMTSLNWRW